MSTDYHIFGWIPESVALKIDKIFLDVWSTTPQLLHDYQHRKHKKFDVVDIYSGPSEFDTSFSLYIRDPNHTIKATISPKGDNNGTLQVSMVPITIDFMAARYHRKQSSMPILTKLAEVCELLEPVLLISMDAEEVGGPESVFTPEPWTGGFPSPNGVAIHFAGLCCLSEILGLDKYIVDNEDIYRTIDYKNGKILASPFGIALNNDAPWLFADGQDRYYPDGVLASLLLERWDPHMTASRDILRRLQFKITE